MPSAEEDADGDHGLLAGEGNILSLAGDGAQASLATLRQRVAALQHLAQEADQGRARAIAEACVLQQQRDFFQNSTKEALSMVAALTEKYVRNGALTAD